MNMKICFLSKDYSYNGGGERMLCNLVNELSLSKEDILNGENPPPLVPSYTTEGKFLS